MNLKPTAFRETTLPDAIPFSIYRAESARQAESSQESEAPEGEPEGARFREEPVEKLPSVRRAY